MKTCPRCEATLTCILHKGIELFTCSQCNGFWFEAGVFSKVKHVGFAGLAALKESPTSQAQVSGTSNPQHMRCPRCSIPLATYNYAYSSDIQLQRCGRCKGIWADYQALVEIERLLVSYQASLDDARAKALPLLMEVNRQMGEEERARKEEQKRRKKERGWFGGLFRKKEPRNQSIDELLTDVQDNTNDTPPTNDTNGHEKQ